MSKKVTKKLLKELGEDFGGYYHGGNVYSFENVLHYIENYNYTSEEIKNKDELQDNKYHNRKELLYPLRKNIQTNLEKFIK